MSNWVCSWPRVAYPTQAKSCESVESEVVQMILELRNPNRKKEGKAREIFGRKERIDRERET